MSAAPRTTRLAALALTAGLVLSACGSDDTSDDSAATPSAAPTAEETTEEPAAAEQAEIPLDETIDDDILENTISFTGLVRDFDSSSSPNIAADGGEWVLVEVDATAGDKFSGGINGGWKLLTADGELAGSASGIIDEDIDAAGFTPWEDISSGESGTGWVAFQVNTRSDAYQLEYKRMAASVIGGGDPIPEKIWTIDLPTS